MPNTAEALWSGVTVGIETYMATEGAAMTAGAIGGMLDDWSHVWDDAEESFAGLPERVQAAVLARGADVETAALQARASFAGIHPDVSRALAAKMREAAGLVRSIGDGSRVTELEAQVVALEREVERLRRLLVGVEAIVALAERPPVSDEGVPVVVVDEYVGGDRIRDCGDLGDKSRGCQN